MIWLQGGSPQDMLVVKSFYSEEQRAAAAMGCINRRLLGGYNKGRPAVF